MDVGIRPFIRYINEGKIISNPVKARDKIHCRVTVRVLVAICWIAKRLKIMARKKVVVAFRKNIRLMSDRVKTQPITIPMVRAKMPTAVRGNLVIIS